MKKNGQEYKVHFSIAQPEVLRGTILSDSKDYVEIIYKESGKKIRLNRLVPKSEILVYSKRGEDSFVVVMGEPKPVKELREMKNLFGVVTSQDGMYVCEDENAKKTYFNPKYTKISSLEDGDRKKKKVKKSKESKEKSTGWDED
jgi:hypothetical protein